MHGGHQLAQKFNTTICPRNWRREMLRSESCTLKVGATRPIPFGREPVLQADRIRSANNISWTEETFIERSRLTLRFEIQVNVTELLLFRAQRIHRRNRGGDPRRESRSYARGQKH